MDHSQHLCPYLERRDSRCAGILTLTNLRDALSRCAGGYEYCPIYHRIRRDELSNNFVKLPVARSA